jgi:hypothetical protein
MWRVVLTTIVLAALQAASTQSQAAAKSASMRVTPGHLRAHCGPCGCLYVGYVYHRELRSSYGLTFDPRNYDTTEPHYFFGPLRAYPRYFIDAWIAPGTC